MASAPRTKTPAPSQTFVLLTTCSKSPAHHGNARRTSSRRPQPTHLSYTQQLPKSQHNQTTSDKQTVTTIARMKKVNLNCRRPEPEAELSRGTHIDKAKHMDGATQRLWPLRCKVAETHLHERAQLVSGEQKKRSLDVQVTVKTHRRTTAAPVAHEGAQNHRTRRLPKLAR